VGTPGLDTGVDLDRIELGSDSGLLPPGGISTGGSAATATVTIPVTDPASVPELTVEETGEVSYRVQVDDASDPFWLVLGQSLSPGWKAQVEGGPSLGEPVLVDGFANGWSVDPSELGSSFTITLTWAPQRVVWAAVGVSALWFLGVLVLLGVSILRRRSRRAGDQEERDLDQDTIDLAATGPVAVDLRARSALAAPVARAGAAVATGLLGLLVGGPVVGVVVAALTLAAAWLPRGRALLAAVPVLLVGATVVVYVGYQVRRHYLPGVEWPTGFAVTHQLVLIAVLSVVAESVLRFCARRWPTIAHSPSAASQMNDGSADTR